MTIIDLPSDSQETIQQIAELLVKGVDLYPNVCEHRVHFKGMG